MFRLCSSVPDTNTQVFTLSISSIIGLHIPKLLRVSKFSGILSLLLYETFYISSYTSAQLPSIPNFKATVTVEIPNHASFLFLPDFPFHQLSLGFHLFLQDLEVLWGLKLRA